MRCPINKARQLIRDAKSSDSFSYSKKRNSLRALSLKSKVWRLSNSKIYPEYRSDFCFLMNKRFSTLNEMVKLLRGIVVMMVVTQAKGRPYKNGAFRESLPYVMVYQTTFANKLGIKQSAVSKLVTYLSNIGWLRKTQQFTYLAVKNGDYEKAEEYSKTHFNCKLRQRCSSRHDGRMKSVSYNYYGQMGLGYQIPDSLREGFRHIIWTHQKYIKA